MSANLTRLLWLLVLIAIAIGIWAGAALFAIWTTAPTPA